MTEDEAKTKICCGPQTVAMMIGLAAPNLQAEVMPEAGHCIASACMAWRPQHDIATETMRGTQCPGDGWLPGPGYDDWIRQRTVSVGGYCGLAGRPE